MPKKRRNQPTFKAVKEMIRTSLHLFIGICLLPAYLLHAQTDTGSISISIVRTGQRLEATITRPNGETESLSMSDCGSAVGTLPAVSPDVAADQPAGGAQPVAGTPDGGAGGQPVTVVPPLPMLPGQPTSPAGGPSTLGPSPPQATTGPPTSLNTPLPTEGGTPTPVIQPAAATTAPSFFGVPPLRPSGVLEVAQAPAAPQADSRRKLAEQIKEKIRKTEFKSPETTWIYNRRRALIKIRDFYRTNDEDLDPLDLEDLKRLELLDQIMKEDDAEQVLLLARQYNELALKELRGRHQRMLNNMSKQMPPPPSLGAAMMDIVNLKKDPATSINDYRVQAAANRAAVNTIKNLATQLPQELRAAEKEAQNGIFILPAESRGVMVYPQDQWYP